MSAAPSVSEKRLVLEIDGKARIPCSLRRHLAPRTVGTIMRSLPLEGHAHTMGPDVLYFETPIDSGMERKRSEFRGGDVAFRPSSGSICFFVRDVSSAGIMTPIGRLGGGDGVGALKDVGRGSVLRLYEEAGEAC